MHQALREMIAPLWEGQIAKRTSFDELPPAHEVVPRVATSSIIDWADRTDVKTVFWLSGYTGVGMTTVAWSVANHLNLHGRLAGSYFVSRSQPESQDATLIIPTLSYRIFVAALETKETPSILADTLGKDRLTIFQKRPSPQWERLVLKPLSMSKAPQAAQQVIVIDGLHDCKDRAQQVDVLTAILDAAERTRGSVKVVISCKPEQHLQRVFRKFGLPAECQPVLGNSTQDRLEVQNFLEHSFKQILIRRQTIEQTMRSVEQPWPSQAVLEKLVDAASGQFLFAKAAVDYVDCCHADPADRLQDLLGDPSRVLETMKPAYLSEALREALPSPAESQGSMHSLVIHLLLHHHHHSSPLRLSDLARIWTKGDCPEVRRTLGPLGLEVRFPDKEDETIGFRHESFVQYMSRLYSLSPHPPLVNITHSGPIVSKCFQTLQMKEFTHPRDFIHFTSAYSLDYCGCSIPTVDIISHLDTSTRLKRMPWTTNDPGYDRFLGWLDSQRFLGWLSAQFRSQGSAGFMQQIKSQLQWLVFFVFGWLYYRALQLGHTFEYAKGAADTWPDFAETAGVYPHLDRVVRFIRWYRRPTPNAARERPKPQ
ncbi:hypothetical protein BDN72DRAFT_847014 [Pluteus cervinus]|uniref:Uncharacterized protein n=1 Tax=Pluteus cervinus TaxID=181527 RepID=A0ACD3ADM7_9AGAR|nr:hypothetical protein BDN72DRAFT_847014 [Pluteus cervinus]